ncbi:MAG: hypothetical protein IPO45_01180 [Saprospiraceae bacterium]|jgi:ribosomal protein S15P/S13E|uniref:hypothetical protein n=1 Tax=Candidatus Brachybacter algidus TaxID=2982024 RepID=UPI001B7089C9|nr:hypothetical protein [Candidatus Brachybacter algidus]MBP7305699.1 hypothetical protein [Saprospiraceae bacterium]MBK6373468.1 hypothetical protein [Candidatus Brachybacter algidus]MBK6449503.1 hypothetical protein [Candidatus Brachybacter algidus]MBK8355217.1 hypothetical protein [Candidatus Brachybacter algidus]MBK8842179.1 hypothetical protein [Candidatus Brachybacter algidus]
MEQDNYMMVLRSEFHNTNTESKLTAFLTKYKNDVRVDGKPYLYCGIMQMANYTMNPYKKLDYFNKGKQALETHISKYPQQIDARYVRALIQSKAPKILNYYQNIQADISFIKKNIQESDVDEKSKSTMLYQIGLIK